MFEEPVTEDIAPGYSEIIDKPMDYLTIEKKIENSEYTTKEQVCLRVSKRIGKGQPRERGREGGRKERGGRKRISYGNLT